MSPEVINGLFAIAGAIIGALLGGLFSVNLARKSKTRKELTTLITKPSRLITIDDQITDDVEVFVSGVKVPTVYLSDLKILNTGNEELSNLKIPVSFKGEGKLLTFTLKDSNFDFDGEGYEIKKTGENDSLITIEFLNPGDQLVVRAMFSDEPEEWEVQFRQPGVSLSKGFDSEGAIPDVFAKTFFEVIRRNWILDIYMKMALPSYRRYREAEDE